MIKKVWDKFFDKNLKTKKFGRHYFDYSKPDADIKKIVHFLKKEGVEKILDLGCGEGRNSKFLSSKNFKVVGIDISKIAIKKAKLNDKKTYYKISDMRSIPYSEGNFDAVISTQTIFHSRLKDIRKTLQQVARVTKNDGIIFITLQPTRGNKYRMGKKIEANTYLSCYGDDAGVVHHFFNKNEIIKEFGMFKMIDLHLDKNNNYWYLLMKNKK